MKYIYRNPILFYIAVPIIVGLWPLLLWAIYLPNAQNDAKEMMAQYVQDAEPLMMEILNLDPARLESPDPNVKTAEFTYHNEVNKIASKCGIPPSKLQLQGLTTQSSGGRMESQSANVKLTQIDITTFTRFLSTIQMNWPNLQCTNLTLEKKVDFPDMWTANIDFKYYF